MKYSKKPKIFISKSFILIFVFLVITLGYFQRSIISRSFITVNLGSLYVKYLNEKAELVNFIENNNIKTISFSLSSNNYVKLQKERSRMVNNYVLTGNQWSGQNTYHKARYSDVREEANAEIRLFGLNPDHFRDVNGHSFRVKFDGKKGFGKKKVNFLNPRSRDFITDPLINIIYSKLYNGIGLEYEPYRVILNKANYGILYQEDFFDKYLIEKNKRRESVIFEIINDSINFNYQGDNNSLEMTAFELQQLFYNDIDSFIKKIDKNKLKDAMKLGLIINDEHPFSDINLHWYYNPVNDLIEPTLREGFIKKIENFNLDKIANNNPIIRRIFDPTIESEILFELNNELEEIQEIIKSDESYSLLKKKMIGFSDQIQEREKIFIDNINFIKQNSSTLNSNEKKENIEIIKITKDTIIEGDFSILSNQKLIIYPGVSVKLDNAYIKVYGGFQAIGDYSNQINITGINNLGTIYFNSTQDIILNNVVFKSLTNNLSGFNQPAAITFYESNSINIMNSVFKENVNGDDYLNFFRSKNIKIENSLFQDILNDAIDSDFSDLSIKNSRFNKIGNDAVDGSGSNIEIDSSKFSYIDDKAVSAGEGSYFTITNSSFTLNEIAVVSKDASNVILRSNKMDNNKIDFSSFVKKQYFGPSQAAFENTKIDKYLIENNSKIIGKDSILFSTDVESKLYGNLYGRASE